MKLKITVHGVSYEVDVEVLDAGEGFPTAGSMPRPRTQKRDNDAGPRPAAEKAPASSGPSDGGSVTSPIAGTILEIKCKVGDTVEKNQILMVIEAMKMKTSIAAPTDGKVKNIPVAAGDSVRENQTLIELE